MARVTHELSVCIDCLFLKANGETTEDPDRTPLGEVAGWDLAVACTDGQEDSHSEECLCDAFSGRRCDGCGSTLAGSRHTLVAFDHD